MKPIMEPIDSLLQWQLDEQVQRHLVGNLNFKAVRRLWECAGKLLEAI